MSARRPDAWRSLLLGTASYLAVALACPRPGMAEVATDGTLGRRVTLRGGNIDIGAELGQQRGGNLFHSFRKLDVETGGRVTFTGPGSVKNVISRVTGGERSSIDGTLASSIPDADLYLLNPAGILFGQNARLDVKGSFHASTAAELRLSDGAVFSALDAAGSTLSVAEPQAFGFLGPPAGGITVNRGVLKVPPGEALSLVGGDVAVAGPEARIDAAAGRITLAGLGGPGTADVATGRLTGGPAADVSITGGAKVDASGDGGGEVRVRANRFSLVGVNQYAPFSSHGGIYADNTGAVDSSGAIDIEADRIEVSYGGLIRADSLATGDAPSISLRAVVVHLVDSEIRSHALDSGNGGKIIISSADLNVTSTELAFGFRTAQVETASYGSGAGGDIAIHAQDIDMRGGRIKSSSYFIGDGGNLNILSKNLTTTEYSTISASGRSNGGIGAIDINVENINASGLNVNSYFGGGESYQSDSDSRITDIQIKASKILMTDSFIDMSTSGIKNAGYLLIKADHLSLIRTGISADTLGFEGDGGDIIISANQISMDGSFINARSFGLRFEGPDFSFDEPAYGSGGDIDIFAGQLVLRSSYRPEYGLFTSEIDTSANELSIGGAGNIRILADQVRIEDASSINSSTAGGGDAGTVVVMAGELMLRGGSIATSSTAEGKAGNVVVSAPSVTLAGGSISSSASGTGSAGTIEVTTATSQTLATAAAVPEATLTGSIGLSDAAAITTSTDGPAAAGQVTVRTGQLSLGDAGTRIASSSTGTGDAGAVRLEVGRSLTLDRATIESSSEGTGAGAGGDVTILARTADVILKGSGTIAASAEGGRPAGDVEVQAQRLDAKDGVIGTSGEDAAGGRITVAARERVFLRDTAITSSGALPDAERGASVIALRAPEIILSRSQVEALTGAGEAMEGSGEVDIDGRLTVISSDSRVDASSGVEIGGLQTNLGSNLQLSPSLFIDVSGLLQPSCAERGASRSTFSRGGRGGLPPAPDRPLASAGATMPGTSPSTQSAVVEPVFMDFCVSKPTKPSPS